MRLFRLHPKVATRSCEHCKKWRYDESTGGLLKDHNGDPMERFAKERLPCDFTPSACPKGTPEESAALSPVNELVYLYYLECRAVGAFPDDPIVRRNAAVIREVEDQIAEEKQWKRDALLRGVKV